MAGSKITGLKSARTNRRKYGADYYSIIGAKGGKKGHTGGFYGDPDRARELGRLAAAKRTPAERKASAKKAWITRRKNSEI